MRTENGPDTILFRDKSQESLLAGLTAKTPSAPGKQWGSSRTVREGVYHATARPPYGRAYCPRQALTRQSENSLTSLLSLVYRAAVFAVLFLMKV